MNETAKSVAINIGFVIWGLVTLCGIGAGVYFHHKYSESNKNYAELLSVVESADADEFKRKFVVISSELKRTKSALARSEQTVGNLEEVDRRRDEGIGRIYGIIDDAGKTVVGITSGEQRARIAFEAIARIVDELEAEFGRSADRR